MGKEVNTSDGRLIDQGPEVPGFSPTVHGLPHDSVTNRFHDSAEGMTTHDESVGGPASRAGGPVASEVRSHQLEGTFSRQVGGELSVEKSDPRTSAPFEAGEMGKTVISEVNHEEYLNSASTPTQSEHGD